MKRFLLSLLFSIAAFQLSAGAGFFHTLFGDGDKEIVCYSRIHRNYYFTIFAAVIGLGIIIYSRYRLKKKSAEKLEIQKSIIEDQNKNILDSIRYASRMQEALKPEETLVNAVLPESFFYLRPRDIVSGDFYFVEECKNKIVLAAIDCTGHGVPGAFLTFIGHNALRHALETLGPENPSKLLDLMNAEVKKTLGQQRSGNEMNDGMEIGLCIYDPATKKVSYAGAGIPLSVFRSGKYEEIKAAKCTVGAVQSHVTEVPPTHIIEFSAGDSFYIGSDGMVDQFGGKEGKKFRREQLRNVLTEMQPLKMADQKIRLETTMSDWMKGFEQTDDMLLIGVRV
ncbi:MAG: serine/threonine-protein phosphatase [Bacteroidota bacterium]|nr:serine/threonine-protein phosphatase [Bacteroidota bacterium]